MDTPIATPNDENLPGVPFSERARPAASGEMDRITRPAGDRDGDRGGGEDSAELDRSSWVVRWVETTGSTNADLVQAALGSAPDRLVLVADHQSAGRGRLDRTWEAQPGANLLMSVLIRSVPVFPHQLTQAVAVAASETCEAIAESLGRRIRVDVKWPNDVLIEGRKVAGILASAGSFSPGEVNSPDFVVVGLGLNIGWAPDGAASLNEALGVNVGAGMRDRVLAGILERMEGLLGDSAEVVHDRYRTKLGTLGREVRAHLPSGEVVAGRALDVEADGRLVVLDTCAVTHRLDVADIVHLR